MEWFQAGGWGMFLILIIGAGSIGYGVRALQAPSERRLATLRALPGLLVTAALFTFGTNMWAVNRFLSNDALVKAQGLDEAKLPFVGIIGLTEATQALTLGGLLAFIVFALRVVAEAKNTR